jgi:hypothetical protein
LSSPTATTPSFTADRPGEALSAGVTVTDKWGHSNDNSTQFTASSCGASPISVSQISDQTDSKAFDPHALSTTASSVDDDPAKCPSRFANTYSYQWSLQNPPPSNRYALTGATTSSATFSAGDNGTWTIQVAATPSTSSSAPGISSIPLVENCSSPSPVVSAPFVLSGDLHVGDTATLATTVDVSACYTNAADAGLTYVWGLSLTSGPGSAPTLSGATTATPSFTVSTPGQQLHATVGVRDKWGHTGGNQQDFTTTS